MLLWEMEKREELSPGMVESHRIKGWFFEPMLGFSHITAGLEQTRSLRASCLECAHPSPRASPLC